MKHYNIKFEPDGKIVTIHAGATINEAAAKASIILNTNCGGKGTCGKCKVIIEPNGIEVLACQQKIESDLTVNIPKLSRYFVQKILDSGIDTNIDVMPSVKKIYINRPFTDPDSLEALMNQPDDSEKYVLSQNVRCKLLEIDSDAFNNGLTAVCILESQKKTNQNFIQYSVISFEPADTTSKLYGVAVDIGTTTVVAKLIDMAAAKVLATESSFNPQSRIGDDVISRINYASTEKKLAELQKLITNCLNEMIEKLCSKTSIDSNDIYEVCVVANTTMNHIFLALPVVQLGQAPYKAYSLDAHDVPARKLGIDINPDGNIHTVENIAGFVGSDTSAVALAVAIDKVKEETLVVDIGTNGELILADKNKLYSASCAAGPAFEGSRIMHGSRAVEGAIEAVLINDEDIDLEVIGDSTPYSICGSGLIDAVAVMLNLGIIDSTGRFVETEKLPKNSSEKIISRMTSYNNQPAFVLYKSDDGKNEVILTQKDIREVQLAKAAIRAGIKLLQKKLNLQDSDIMHILLAGAFGSYIRRESALRIGLLPQVPIERIKFIGNAAYSGAQMVLLSQKARKKVKELAKKIEYVEIAHQADFTMVYADSMFF